MEIQFFSVENNSLLMSFWQKVSHSIEDYNWLTKVSHSIEDYNWLTVHVFGRKNWISFFFEFPIFRYSRSRLIQTWTIWIPGSFQVLWKSHVDLSFVNLHTHFLTKSKENHFSTWAIYIWFPQLGLRIDQDFGLFMFGLSGAHLWFSGGCHHMGGWEPLTLENNGSSIQLMSMVSYLSTGNPWVQTGTGTQYPTKAVHHYTTASQILAAFPLLCDVPLGSGSSVVWHGREAGSSIVSRGSTSLGSKEGSCSLNFVPEIKWLFGMSHAVSLHCFLLSRSLQLVFLLLCELDTIHLDPPLKCTCQQSPQA